MKCFHVASLLLGYSLAVTGREMKCYLELHESEVIMKMPSEDGFPNKLYEGESLSAYNDTCTLKLNGDGNLVVKRYVSLDSVPGYVPVSQAEEYDTFRTAWSTGAHGTGDYVASLQGDGNFVVYRVQGNGNQAMFKTRSAIPKTEHANWQHPISQPSDTFALAFRPDCSLVLMRYYYEREVNNNVNVYKSTTWSNFRHIETSRPPTNAIVQKGEMIKDCECFCSPHLMSPNEPHDCSDSTNCVPVPLVAILKQNCNFEIYIGHDMADAMTRVWTSNTPRTDLDDCYLYAFDEGPALVEGVMNPLIGTPNSSKKYWSMDIYDFGDDPNIKEWYQLQLHTTGLALWTD